MYKLINNIDFYSVPEVNKLISDSQTAILLDIDTEITRATSAENQIAENLTAETDRAKAAERFLQTEIDNLGSMAYENVTDATFTLEVGKPKSYTGTSSSITVTLAPEDMEIGMWYKLMFKAPSNFTSLNIIPPTGYRVDTVPAITADDVLHLIFTICTESNIICTADIMKREVSNTAIVAGTSLKVNKNDTIWTDPVIMPRLDSPVLAVANSDSMYVIITANKILYSSTLDMWNEAILPAGASNLADIKYANGLFVVVGGGPSDAVGTLLYSSDGITWNVADDASGQSYPNYQRVTYGNGIYVATGVNSIIYSVDGISWGAAVIYADETQLAETTIHDIRDINYANGLFTAVGFGSDMFAGVYYSVDGIRWICGTTNVTGNFILKDVQFGNNKYVAIGTVILTSSDGKTWTNVPMPNDLQPVSIAFGNNSFVIVGAGDKTAYSLDTETWTIATLPTGAAGMKKVIYAFDKFIAAGTNIVTSNNGIDWIISDSGIYNTVYCDIYENVEVYNSYIERERARAMTAEASLQRQINEINFVYATAQEVTEALHE